MIILAFDALDLNMVERYNCKNLMQIEYGQTSLSGFQLERTVVLWASFLTGKNMESMIPVKNQWEFKLRKEDTFIPFYKTHKVIDLPAFSLKEKNHEEERKLLKKYVYKETTIEEYEKIVWKNHEENKKDFFKSLGHFDLIIGYFDLADAIGHLSFGIHEKMEIIYLELEGLTRKVKSLSDEFVLIISDHGMKPVGRYGDHSRTGFYSLNINLNLNFPRITDFYNIIKNIKK